ncbi:hypothetical protein ABEB36_005046 [Hypothenemus hampei]
MLKNISPTSDPSEGCKICEEVIGGIISLRRSNATREVMMDYLLRLCVLYIGYDQESCSQRVNIESDAILYIIDHKEDLRPERFCAIYFIQYQCKDPNADDWSIPLPPYPDNLTKATTNNDTVSFQILQISDVHIDPSYTSGSNAACSEPLCCESGVPDSSDNAAGYWGDYGNCDMPWYTMENMLETINSKNENLDFVYFTGDIVSHSWAISIQKTTNIIKQFLGLLRQNFPNQTVFPILGNHEAAPNNFYSPESVDKNSNVSSQWLFDLIAEEWSEWLPNDTLSTIRKGGFYTVLVKPGFRIVALNSIVCYKNNLWTTFENQDTYGQLQWLVNILTEAEQNGEKVHILSHIPSSDDSSSCVTVWAREYKKIILRFSETISAQFNGHTHYDEFKLYFDSNKVKSVAYNGGSFTTYIGSNPNYRIYQVDSNNLTVTDYSDYILNLAEANTNSSSNPIWYKLYSFKEEYDLPDLTLESLENLYNEMTSNDTDNKIVEKYYRYKFRDSEVHNKQGCDLKCKKKLVCMISAGDTSQGVTC